MRTIDADELRKTAPMWLDGTVLVMPVSALDDAPTIDSVEVVRCERCEYGYKRFMSDDAVVCGFDERIHNEKWFCAAGERRNDETD